MTKNENLLRGVVAALMIVGVVACATVATPPRVLLAKNDHTALETWHVKEAAYLRQRAKDMMVMAEEYQKNPGPSTRSVNLSKIDVAQHCQTLAEI